MEVAKLAAEVTVHEHKPRPEGPTITWYSHSLTHDVHGYHGLEPWLDVDIYGFDSATSKLYILFMDGVLYEFDDATEDEFKSVGGVNLATRSFRLIPHIRDVMYGRGCRILRPSGIDPQADARKRFEGKVDPQ